ncbi:outer membrane protein OmpA-like peptidoglycan-associated protein [Oxalobacteraceae bacterium GrIS 2.11]
MKKFLLVPSLITIAVLMTACSTTPRSTSLLEQTRSDYAVIHSNPNVERMAPLEMQQATEAMNQANEASTKDKSAEDVDKLAYVAKSKIGVAREVTKQKMAEKELASTAKERDAMVLNQRTLEADKAKQSAAESQATAQAALADAAASQRQTDAAKAQAAQLQAQLADLAAKQTDRGLVITLGDVLFGTDLSRLTSDGMRTAQKLADVLNQNPQRTVLVEGYTDSTGSAAHNQELSERRAQSVKSALQGMGISGDRAAVRGFGEQFPVAANDTSANRQMNRRVEIVISDANGKIIQR